MGALTEFPISCDLLSCGMPIGWPARHKQGFQVAFKREKQMDWRVILTTFGVIFLAELGDKTQLAAMTLAAQTRRPWAVLIGASIALACVSAIGVAVGGLLGEYLPLAWIKRAAAVAFIIIGVLILVGKF
jgi:putative Ca2+/H+ antiporter (TMEM165/GDT1 family)